MTEIAPTFEMLSHHWKHLQKSGDRHKYLYGHGVVVSGPFGNGGAARLAARGALRVGAGLVSVACTADALPEHAPNLTAIMIKPFDAEASFAEHLKNLNPSAICIGPNLGLDDRAKEKLAATLTQGCPICVDADAITLLSATDDNRVSALHPKDVMTPHEGELRRFVPDVYARTSCRVGLAKAAAAKANCVVLFKGVDTLIAAPNGECREISARAFQHASWLATAGSGDVLAGFITGLLARGFAAMDAAAIGAALHLRCAEAFGPGLIAEDIPEMLPQVLRVQI